MDLTGAYNNETNGCSYIQSEMGPLEPLSENLKFGLSAFTFAPPSSSYFVIPTLGLLGIVWGVWRMTSGMESWGIGDHMVAFETF